MKIDEFEINIISDVPEAVLVRVTDTIKNLEFEVEMFGPLSGIVEQLDGKDIKVSEQYMIRLATIITDYLYEPGEELT